MSRSIDLYIVSATDGTPDLTVDHTTTGLALTYALDYATAVDCTPDSTLSALTDTHTPLAILHKGNGVYRFDAPNAAFVGKVTFQGTATGLVILPLIYGRVVDPDDGIADYEADRIRLAAVAGVTGNDGKDFYNPSGTKKIIAATVAGTERTGVVVTPGA